MKKGPLVSETINDARPELHPAASGSTPAAARLQIILGAVLFSTGGAAIKACAFAGLAVAGLRSGIAVLAILLLIPSARSIGTWRTWLVGSGYALTMISFVLSNKLTTAANAIFIQGTAPLYILVLGPLLLREPIRKRDLAYLAVLAAGLSLFFIGPEAPRDTAPHPLLGNLVSLGSAAGWALTILGLRWLGKSEAAAADAGRSGSGGSPGAAVVAGNLLACLGTMPWWSSALDTGRVHDWLAVGYLGVFQIALAYRFVTAGMRRVPALEASLLLMVEPVLSPIWAFLLLGERPSMGALCGGAVILAATLVRELLARRPLRVRAL